MKDLLPVKVECHSGYKADEYPRCFFFDNHRIDVEEIIDRWYQISPSLSVNNSIPEFPDAKYFKVRTPDQKIYILKHETETGNWFVWIRGESMNLS